MLSRISVNVLLKSVISALALGVVVLLGIGAWSSWNRVTAVTRIHAVAEASGYLFTALHNLRVDRATTVRELNSDQPVTGANSMLQQVRSSDMPALKAGLALLQDIDFPERSQAVSRLGQAINKLEALHKESNAAFTQPKAQRRSGLPPEYSKEVTDLMALIDGISSRAQPCGQASGRADRPSARNQATRLDRSQRRRRCVGHDLEFDGGSAAAGRADDALQDEHCQAGNRVVGAGGHGLGLAASATHVGRHPERPQRVSRQGLHRTAHEDAECADRQREDRDQRTGLDAQFGGEARFAAQRRGGCARCDQRECCRQSCIGAASVVHRGRLPGVGHPAGRRHDGDGVQARHLSAQDDPACDAQGRERRLQRRCEGCRSQRRGRPDRQRCQLDDRQGSRDHLRHQVVGERGDQRLGRDFERHHRSVSAHGRAGGFA